MFSRQAWHIISPHSLFKIGIIVWGYLCAKRIINILLKYIIRIWMHNFAHTLWYCLLLFSYVCEISGWQDGLWLNRHIGWYVYIKSLVGYVCTCMLSKYLSWVYIFPGNEIFDSINLNNAIWLCVYVCVCLVARVHAKSRSLYVVSTSISPAISLIVYCVWFHCRDEHQMHNLFRIC